VKFDLGPDPLGASPAERKSLREIEDALERLKTGDFGYCEACGSPISVRRLCLDPTTSRCVNCDEDERSD